MRHAIGWGADEPDDLQELFDKALSLVDPIVKAVARRRRLPPEDADDLASAVRVKLLSDGGAVLRKFRGGSSLSTYLTVVVERVLLDERIARWGKWRPSASARREGPAAVILERLTLRDGVPLDEAVEILRVNHGLTPDEATARRLASGRQVRQWPRLVDYDAVEEPVDARTALDAVDAAAHTALMKRAVSTLSEALAALDEEDTQILTLRFRDDMSIAAIARALSLQQKPLYRRMNRLLRALSDTLKRHGISASGVLDALDRSGGRRPRLP
jgi:RNA polymerase sigma factor for flagellar operon FliA